MLSRRSWQLPSLTAFGIAAVLLTGLAAGPASAELSDPFGAAATAGNSSFSAMDFERAVSNAKLQRDTVGTDGDASTEIVVSGTIVLEDTDALHPVPTGVAYRIRVEDEMRAEVETVDTPADFSLTLPGGKNYYLRAEVIGENSGWMETWYGDTRIPEEADAVASSESGLTINVDRSTTAAGSVTTPSSAGLAPVDFLVQTFYYERSSDALYKLSEIRTAGTPTSEAWTLPLDSLSTGDYVFRLTEIGYPKFDDQYVARLPRFQDRAVVNVPAAGRFDIDFFPTPFASEVNRTAGVDRYATAVRVTKSAFDGDVPVLYLASGANWPDALSAGPAAAKQGGALLLTDPDTLPSVVAAEIKRLSPGRIVVVGSSLSVSEAVYDRVTAEFGAETERIAGTDRYDTSRRIVADAFPNGPYGNVFLATGTNFPDALSVAPIAGRRGEPVLLVDGARSSLDESTRAALDRLDADRGQLVGGTPSISSAFEADLDSSAVTGLVDRVAGVDRHDTSRLLNDAFPPFDITDTVFLATATGFADALSVGAAAAAIGAPLYLSEPTCLPRATRVELQSHELDYVTLLGSRMTLSAALETLTVCN